MGKESLSMRVYNDHLYTTICRAVGYVGFPFRELAAKMKPLVEQHGAKKVSEALVDLVVHTGWRTMLSPQARKACWGLLGPPPEKWDTFYTTWDGKPTPRPPHHQMPPAIPPPQPDPFLDALVRLVYTELSDRLKDARMRKDVGELQAIESEMIRRGMDLPSEEKQQETVEAKPRKPARKRKE